MKRKEITLSELGRMFELFQKAHPECPYMYMTFDAFMAGKGIRPAIYYGLFDNCYIASYSTNSVEDLYDLMRSDVENLIPEEL